MIVVTINYVNKINMSMVMCRINMTFEFHWMSLNTIIAPLVQNEIQTMLLGCVQWTGIKEQFTTQFRIYPNPDTQTHTNAHTLSVRMPLWGLDLDDVFQLRETHYHSQRRYYNMYSMSGVKKQQVGCLFYLPYGLSALKLSSVRARPGFKYYCKHTVYIV